MAAPSAYLDECVHHGLAEALRKRGFFVLTAQAAGAGGADDDEQLAYAAERGLILLSYNRRHFRRWHLKFQQEGRGHAGIILLPASSPLPQLTIRAAMMLDWIATLPDHRSQLFRWGDLQYRLTQGYRLPGYSEAEVRMALGQQ